MINRHREFFRNFCKCNINGIPSIFMWKKNNIRYRICTKTGAISKYVSTIAFLYEINRGKRCFLQFDLNQNEPVKFEILINNIWMGIASILVRIKIGVTVEILKRGLSQTLKMCQIRGGLVWNPWTKVNIINFYYNHNILMLFTIQ